MKISIIPMIVLLSAGTLAWAETNRCWVKAPVQDDRWAIIYQADRDGTRGDIIWKGKIPANKKVRIESKSGYLCYEYAGDPEHPYQGDTSVLCAENRVILLP